MSNEASLTLALLRGGAPNSEVLVAKGVEELLAIAARHGIAIPNSSPSASPAKEEDTSVRRTKDQRFTFEPPSVHTSHALSRARAWRYQHMVEQAEAELQAGMENGPASMELAAAEAAAVEAAAAEREAGVLDGPAAAELATAEAATHRLRSSETQRATGDPSSLPSPEAVLGSYEGDFDEAGERCGLGQCTYDTGVVYVGTWKHNKPEGRGTLYYPTGDVFEGNFANGIRQGSGTYAFADGRIEVASYHRGINARGEGAMWSARRTTAWRIVKDGEEVEEISIAESHAVAARVGEEVPGRFWREERLQGAASVSEAAATALTNRLSLEPEEVVLPAEGAALAQTAAA